MGEPAEVELSLDDIRHVAAFAATCARRALPIFEASHPNDLRPRSAIDGAGSFAETGHRTAELRRLAWDAHKAAREVTESAAIDAALAAMHAAGAAFLHPLYSPHQVTHILGSAVHLALTDSKVVAEQIEWIDAQSNAIVRAILRRFPSPAAGRTKFGILLVQLDTELRR
ncbi:exonuclease SbcC [Rhodococcus sp. IEGM 1381]|uniref:putative immunity protein n=1 Tax=Rhodococcus sp. IEGM 1381 TaxID=3047085 RepID=UPI0024B78D55|nr:exonuclease SbcC [Rhodococcus sp. IEGM 1381]MDI9893754.1 exonuclease SbcC [Rhodococcus sp. IEGM 1381]